MINLPTVSLVCIASNHINGSIHALLKSIESINFGKVCFLTDATIDIDKKIEIIRIPRIKTKQEYNIFTMKNLADYIQTDYCLSVQWDGYILNPNTWTDDFLKYDYIGAPWGKIVGNSGFCLRSKKLLQETKLEECYLKSESKDILLHDDWLTCIIHKDLLVKKGIKFAPFEVANKFSVERKPYQNQFGFHDFYGMNFLKPILD